jgi:hypothetical protein
MLFRDECTGGAEVSGAELTMGGKNEDIPTGKPYFENNICEQYNWYGGYYHGF